MIELDAALDEAMVLGKARLADGARRIPAFVPGGEAMDWLFDHTLEMLRLRFTLFDVRGPNGYELALDSFALRWHAHSEEDPASEESYSRVVPNSDIRLLIVCGAEPYPRFWKNLRMSSALHIGAAFPPFLESRNKCFTVPDIACVCVLVKESDFAGIPSGVLDPVYRYTSDKSSWIG